MKVQGKTVWVLVSLLVSAQCGLAAAPRGRYIVHTTGEAAVNEKARHGVEEHAGQVLKQLAKDNGLVVLIPEVVADKFLRTVNYELRIAIHPPPTTLLPSLSLT